MKRKGAGQAVTSAPMLFPEEERDVSQLSQWYTPPRAACALHEFAAIPAGARVLEPSAGRGALILPRSDLDWTAIDIDPLNCLALLGIEGVDVGMADFLSIPPPDEPFDFVVMNPPYEGDADLAHVLHALDFGRQVVAILRADFEHSEKRWNEIWRWIRRDDEVAKLTFVNRPFKGAMSNFVVWRFTGRQPDEGPGEWRSAMARQPGSSLVVEQQWGRG